MTRCGVTNISDKTRLRKASVPGAEKLPGVLAVFRRAKPGDEFFGLSRRHPGPAQEPIHHHQRGDLLRRLFVNAVDDGSAHAVADERGLVHPGVVHHRQDGAGEIIHAVLRRQLVAVAVAGEVNEHQPRLVRQRRDLLAPEAEVARPAMDKKKGVSSPTHGDVVNLVRAEGDGMRFAVGQRSGLQRRGATGKGRLPGDSVCKTGCFHHNPKSLVAADRARPGSGNDIRDV